MKNTLPKKNISFTLDNRVILIALLAVLLIVGITNSGNIRTFVGIVFDILDDRQLIPVNPAEDVDYDDSNINSFWFEKELNIYIETNEEVPMVTRNAVLDTIFSTQLTTYGGFIGWQGALDRINLAYPDNNVPNKFQLVENKNIADITITLDSLPDPTNPNRGGVAITSSTPNLMIPHTIGVDIIIYDADDKNHMIVASIARHELGHALGLNHSERFNDLMSPAIIFDMKTISGHNVENLYQNYR